MISNKQLEEIDFLIKHFDAGNPSKDQIQDYIDWSVKGSTIKDNTLVEARRRFDITLKMWRKDLVKGYISYSDLIEDFNHPYINKVLNSTMKGIIKDRDGSIESLDDLLSYMYFDKRLQNPIGLLNRQEYLQHETNRR